MKNIVKILSVFAFVLAVIGCGKEQQQGVDANIVGEWHLVELTGMTSVPQVYLTLAQNMTFDLYQKVGDGRYRRYTGTYTFSNGILNGIYSDKCPWGSSYSVSSENDMLVLSAENGTGEVSKYERKALPESDKADAELVTKSVEEGQRFL